MTDPLYDDYLADMENAYWAERQRLHEIDEDRAYDDYLASMPRPKRPLFTPRWRAASFWGALLVAALVIEAAIKWLL